MAVHVINGGFFTTVQDEGRFGYLSRGIPASGAMDLRSYEDANMLVGNINGEAVLEMTVFGGTYRFDEDVLIAITGADMSARLDGTEIPMYEAVEVKDGSILTLSATVHGCRTYLAVAGGFDVPIVMGSRSTYVKYSIGGFKGRNLKRGDILETGRAYGTVQEKDVTVRKMEYPEEIVVRVVPGPQEDAFTDKGIRDFYRSEYTVSDKSDRMGYRMTGTAAESICGTDIISDATVFGSIQITGSGQPLVLMADRQTNGGYAKIGTVFSEDLPLLAQSKPGTKVRFRIMNDEEWM